MLEKKWTKARANQAKELGVYIKSQQKSNPSRSKEIQEEILAIFKDDQMLTDHILKSLGLKTFKYVMTEEHKLAIGTANKGNKSRTGQKHTAESKAKTRASVKKYYDSGDHQEELVERAKKISVTQQHRFATNPTLKEDISKRLKAAYEKDPSIRERQRQATKEYYQSEEGIAARLRKSEKYKVFFQTEEGKALIRQGSEAKKAYYQTEAGIEFRKRQAINAGNYWRNRPKTRAHKEAISRGMQKAIKEGRYRPGTYSKRGHHQSPKAGRVPYRSSYEEAYYKVLDEDPLVATYEAEPNDCHVEYEFDGMSKIYVPDILIYFMNGEHIIAEIKPSDRANEPQNQAKHEAAYKEFGDVFIVLSENEVFGGKL